MREGFRMGMRKAFRHLDCGCSRKENKFSEKEGIETISRVK
jgi:hypothetical protein